jgi:hypothetical protein
MKKHMQRDTQAGLARRWGWHKSRVCRLFQSPGAPRFTDGQIEVEEAEVWRDRRAAARADGGRWRRELDRLKAVLLQMELTRLQDSLVSRADIKAQAKQDGALILASLKSMPDTLAPQIVGLTNTAAVAAVLKSWARSTLQSWHDTITKGDQ